MRIRHLAIALTLSLTGAACGVKGPPLPPVDAIPGQSDLREEPRPSPQASPTVSARPKTSKSKKSSGP